MPDAPVLRPARPAVPGVREVLRAHFPARSHAYPLHTHDAWTLMVVDQGAVVYHLDRREQLAPQAAVTLLPPHVPHDGAAASDAGFRKRVVYLAPDVLASVPLDRVLTTPLDGDRDLVREVSDLHTALLTAATGVDTTDAEERLTLLAGRLVARWGGPAPTPLRREAGRVSRLRAILDERAVTGVTLAEAAAELDSTPAALVRAFQREVGMTPHRYLVGRRLEIARRRLLDGVSVADAAADSGFFDQAHLTRHFRRYLGIPPGRFVRAFAG
ncbi:AraC family transcriptional regulator [Phycicoccus sp. CSK15P-2]|uniref:helix-turn-helix transcriptional regulator n=1 Tax=Phycicoccus sp. CSK15P-2 TaxID=2807627 RepID=UPI0019504B2F|nr:AraC family transcriptional regulator [Phycicoccus sp. CSK15P-2]MBM6403083.1 AraC family transcriptional regulator [Phycicoccus sp. CSK15P-2]